MKWYRLNIFIIGTILDLVIGDPRFFPHPVVIIGRLIDFLEKKARKVIDTKRGELVAGFLLVLVVVAITFCFFFYGLKIVGFINSRVLLITNIYFFSSTLAIKGLAKAGKDVFYHLVNGDLSSARQKTGMIVGRDTDKMKEEDLVRAVIETIAENISDGIIAPLFYFVWGGVPLAITYKAVNTLDSMIGHRSEKYLYLGRVAARLDDIVNYIPARLTAFSIWLGAVIGGFNWKRVLQVVCSDASKHPSPNAGFPEAAAAGALDIRLGGLNYYQGQPEFRSYLGKDGNPGKREDIRDMIKLMYLSVMVFWLGALLFIFL